MNMKKLILMLCAVGLSGAAFAAGLTSGIYKDLDELSGLWKEKERFESCMEEDVREQKAAFWHKAVSRTLGWTKRD